MSTAFTCPGCWCWGSSRLQRHGQCARCWRAWGSTGWYGIRPCSMPRYMSYCSMACTGSHLFFLASSTMKMLDSPRLRQAGKFLVTALTVCAAAYAGWQLWVHYEMDPWTRDGRVKAYVVQVAPDVSGMVTSVPVHDNQSVKKGDVL